MKLLALLFLLAMATSAQDDDFAARLNDFNQPYAQFFRRFAGCSDYAKDLTECNPQSGAIDRRLYGQAREAAKKLFDLTDPEGQ